jgi:hypothetical protein
MHFIKVYLRLGSLFFYAPDAHFDQSSLPSGTQAEKVGNPKKKL